MERSQSIGDLTRAGMEAARAKGVRIGRPQTLSADVVARIVSERAAGSTLASIGADLEAAGVPTAQGGTRWWPATVAKVLVSQAAARLAA